MEKISFNLSKKDSKKLIDYCSQIGIKKSDLIRMTIFKFITEYDSKKDRESIIQVLGKEKAREIMG